MNNEKKNVFETKIQPILEYVGAIGAAIMIVAYIVCIFVLIKGFKVNTILNTTIFSIVNAAVGFLIMQFLKVQGQSFAENLEENKELLKRYYSTKTKDKKIHSIKYFWITSVIKDIAIKGLTLAATSVGIIYLVIQGSNDWSMLLLAFVNLLMFICFGLLALNKAYNFFNNQHIPYIKEQLKIMENQDVNNQ